MRGSKGKVRTPSAIISTAVYMGLVALVRISRDRASKKTRRFYQSINKMWTYVRDSLSVQKISNLTDFSVVQNAEPNMRGQFLKYSWTTARQMGSKESKRVYSWLEGSVGPLNALLNYAGARLRDLAMFLYPFPKPLVFEIRKYPDGICSQDLKN